jgi:phage terminase large subunit-like protein
LALLRWVKVARDALWLAEFRRELTMFPNARHDDWVGSLSEFLKWMDQPFFQWYVGGSRF